jgi:hypothetical protein
MYDYHIFCCVNERPDSAVRECCRKKNSLILRNHMKKKNKRTGFKKNKSKSIWVLRQMRAWTNNGNLSSRRMV